MTCRHCESPNVTLQFNYSFCCMECCRFYLKTQRNEAMDAIIQNNKECHRILDTKNSTLVPKMKRMCLCLSLFANQVKIGNFEMIQHMRRKYIDVLGEVDEALNDWVKRGGQEIYYMDMCSYMKETLETLDNFISIMDIPGIV